MGNTDSGNSFELAVKHLFRHLHDPRILRKNPLVAHFFKEVPLDGLTRAREDRTALAEIHDRVRRAAKHCYDSDVSAGKAERTFRQHEIITRQCLDRRPIREVAQALGISIGQCYRERSAICRRVGQYLSESNQKLALESLTQVDEFGLLLSQARYRTAFPDAKTATRVFDDLVQIAPSLEEKVEAFRTSAWTSLEFGNLAGAEEAYSNARAVFEKVAATVNTTSQAIARASLELLRGELANERGELTSLKAMSARAIAHLQGCQTGSPLAAALYAESLFEQGAALWNLGNHVVACDWIGRAEASLRHAPATFLLRMRIEASLWKMRTSLLLDGRSWYPAWKRHAGLLKVFHEAYQSGALRYTTESLAILTEHHAFTGRDDEALKAGRMAVRLAEGHQSRQARVCTRLEVAVRLLSTRHWRYASQLLAGMPSVEMFGAYHQELLTYSITECLFRAGRFHDALALASSRGKCLRRAGLAVRNQIVAAAAAHALGRTRDARDIVASALPAAEGLRSAPILRDAYGLAGRIMREPRFTRKAAEITRLMTA